MRWAGALGRGDGRSERAFKWTALAAGACLAGFVAFVVVRGPAHPTTGTTAALESPPPALLRDGTQAPPFTLGALGGGEPVTLAAHLGKPVILNFFASWCPDCRRELAALATVARTTSGRITVLGVDSNETSDSEAEQLLAQADATYPVALDDNATVATRYLVVALPVSYFLDAQGRVVGAAVGAQTVQSLRPWVDRLERER